MVYAKCLACFWDICNYFEYYSNDDEEEEKDASANSLN